MVFLVLGSALILAPQSRAQSEVAPDHFDGTDSWARAASAKVSPGKAKPRATSTALQSGSTNSSLQPVAAHDVVTSRRSNAIATSKKRKPSTR